MNIQICRIDKTLPLPQYETKGSFAFDFIVREKTVIPPRGIALIPANVIIACPEHLALLILPRSSLARKKHLLIPNAPGLIDADYHGPEDEIRIQVLNISDQEVFVDRGERIAQGLFVHVHRAEFEESHVPKGDSRGGFGSTG